VTAPSHIVFGLSSALAAVKLGAALPDALSILAIIIGSLAPDIDSPRSTISKPGQLFTRFLPPLVTDLMNVAGSLVSVIVKHCFGHRGALHWPLTAAILFLAADWSGLTSLRWFCLGYASHIAADFCTKGGISIFAPVYRKRIKWSPLKTGSIWEFFISIILLIVLIVAGFEYLPFNLEPV